MVAKKIKKIGSTLIMLVVLLVAFAFLATWFLKQDAKRVQSHADAATRFGRAQLIDKCEKEGFKSELCESISISNEVTECDAKTCWIIYGRTDGSHGYGGGVTVALQNNNYVALSYIRDAGIKP